MVETLELFEFVWVLASAVSLTACLKLLIESERDVRVIRKRKMRGPIELLALNTRRGAYVRLLMAILIGIVALMFALHNRPAYSTLPSFKVVPYLLMAATVLLAINVLLDSRCRGKVQKEIRATNFYGQRKTDPCGEPEAWTGGDRRRQETG